jgi:predicted  nucleic acid-binding Zn-ribbon protein
MLSFALAAAAFFLFTGAGFCEDKPRSFTNDDIDNYRMPSDNSPQEQRKTAPSAIKDESRKARGKQEQEYWCKRANVVKRKIEKADRELREREEEISHEQSKSVRTSRKMNTLQSRLKKAKDHLSSAERDLSDIENEAHRKSIPPGWLRCQFD